MIGLKIFCPRLSGKKIYQIFYKFSKIKLNFGYFLANLATNTIKRQNALFFLEIRKISDKIFSRTILDKIFETNHDFIKMDSFDRQDFQQIDQF